MGEMRPKLLPLKEAARYLGVSEKTIRRYIAEGLIKTRRLPLPENPTEYLERTLIRTEELDRLEEQGVTIG